MKRQRPDIVEQTLAFWKRRTGQEFSGEDVRQMLVNVAGFFTVLHEWEQKAREADGDEQGKR